MLIDINKLNQKVIIVSKELTSERLAIHSALEEFTRIPRKKLEYSEDIDNNGEDGELSVLEAKINNLLRISIPQDNFDDSEVDLSDSDSDTESNSVVGFISKKNSAQLFDEKPPALMNKSEALEDDKYLNNNSVKSDVDTIESKNTLLIFTQDIKKSGSQDSLVKPESRLKDAFCPIRPTIKTTTEVIVKKRTREDSLETNNEETLDSNISEEGIFIENLSEIKRSRLLTEEKNFSPGFIPFTASVNIVKAQEIKAEKVELFEPKPCNLKNEAGFTESYKTESSTETLISTEILVGIIHTAFDEL